MTWRCCRLTPVQSRLLFLSIDVIWHLIDAMHYSASQITVMASPQQLSATSLFG